MGRMKELKMFSEQLGDMDYTEFESLIAETIKSLPIFSNVLAQSPSSLFDIMAEEKLSESTSTKSIFLVKQAEVVTPDYIEDCVSFWRYFDIFSMYKTYLITNGTLTEEANNIANKLG